MYDNRTALLWDVVLGDATWEDALAAVSQSTMGASVFLMSVHDGAEPKLRTHCFDPGPLGEDGFRAHVSDPANPFARRMAKRPVGSAFDRREIISNEEFERHPWSQPYRHQPHGLIACPERSKAAVHAFWIQLPSDHVDAIAPAFSGWVSPIRRALASCAKIAKATDESNGFAGALSHLGAGAVIVDPDLRIRQLNGEAERILQRGDGLEVRLGRLSIRHGSGAQQLKRRIGMLWQDPNYMDIVPVRIRRQSGLPAYSLEVVPARFSKSAAVILITDPVRAERIPGASRVAQQLGLTVAEARIVRLVPLALTKAQIAEKLGLSENTVRTHLMSARGKLGARNVLDLAMIVRQQLTLGSPRHSTPPVDESS